MEWMPVSKATKRILKESKERLEAEGHTLVPFIVNDDRIRQIIKTYGSFTANNLIPGLAALQSQHYEKLVHQYKKPVAVFGLPNWVKSVISNLLYCLGQKRDSFRASIFKKVTQAEMDLLYLDKDKFKDEFDK